MRALNPPGSSNALSDERNVTLISCNGATNTDGYTDGMNDM